MHLKNKQKVKLSPRQESKNMWLNLFFKTSLLAVAAISLLRLNATERATSAMRELGHRACLEAPAARHTHGGLLFKEEFVPLEGDPVTPTQSIYKRLRDRALAYLFAERTHFHKKK